MKTKIEADRIRLIAECGADNEAVCAIVNIFSLMPAPEADSAEKSIRSDYGRYKRSKRNDVCIPLADDAMAAAVSRRSALVEPEWIGPKTTEALDKIAEQGGRNDAPTVSFPGRRY
ncbi:MAG: hypothetical protein AB9869_09710 [Verrucomicrobiia bacterium]